MSGDAVPASASFEKMIAGAAMMVFLRPFGHG